ncbi:hypothetical protein ACVI1L_004806 [Bradyrhizobium sp. USDA 4516]
MITHMRNPKHQASRKIIAAAEGSERPVDADGNARHDRHAIA